MTFIEIIIKIDGREVPLNNTEDVDTVVRALGVLAPFFPMGHQIRQRHGRINDFEEWAARCWYELGQPIKGAKSQQLYKKAVELGYTYRSKNPELHFRNRVRLSGLFRAIGGNSRTGLYYIYVGDRLAAPSRGDADAGDGKDVTP